MATIGMSGSTDYPYNTTVTARDSLPARNTSDSRWVPIVIAVSIIPEVLAVVTTNSVVLITLIRTPDVRKVVSYFNLNLILIDLQSGMFCLPAIILSNTDGIRRLLGPSLCILVTTLPMAIVLAGMWNVVLMAVEKLVIIMYPFRFQRRFPARMAVPLIICMWIIVVLFTFWPAVRTGVDLDTPLLYCDGLLKYEFAYVILYYIFGIAFSLVAICVLYTVMYNIARRHVNAINSIQVQPEYEATPKMLRLVTHSKAARTAFVVSSLYLVCWAPLLTVGFVQCVCVFRRCPASLECQKLVPVFIGTTVWAFLSSVLNPIVYSLHTPDLRQQIYGKCRVRRA